ncbi:MAG: sigma-70 domain-containing protein [Candidatus Pacearchaeota archaeon]
MPSIQENKAKEMDLWKAYKDGDYTARNQLLTSLDPLLKKSVNKYVNSGLPRESLETEARFLAAKAFESYDPSKAQLNTHVTNHLKHLQRFVIEYQNIAKIPENRAIQISKFHNIKTNLNEKLGREPNTIELSEELSWSPAEVERMVAEQRKDLTMVSGEDIFYEDQFRTQDITLEAIWFVYYDVGAEDRKILEYTFGLFGNMKQPVAEIAKKLNKSESYVLKRYKDLAEKINSTRGII